MSSSTVNLPLERNRWFRDFDDVLSTTKTEREKIQLVLNWADQLADSETISAVAYTDSGVTRTSTSSTTTTTTTTVLGVGELLVKVTTSLGNILEQRVRFYNREGGMPRDYQG